MIENDLAFQPVSPRPLDAKHQLETRKFQGIPGIEITATGRLWATWYGGGTDEGADNYVVLSTSIDGGKTWAEQLVIDPSGDVRAFDASLWIDPLGRLWWTWSQSHSVNGSPGQAAVTFDGRAGVWAVVSENTENPVWSSPRRIGHDRSCP